MNVCSGWPKRGRSSGELREEFQATIGAAWWAVLGTYAAGIVAWWLAWLPMDLPRVSVLAALLLLTSEASGRLVERVRQPLRLYFTAHAVNIVLVTAIIHYVGGVALPVAPLFYSLIVINAGIVGHWPAYVLAAFCALCYGCLGWLELSAGWPPAAGAFADPLVAPLERGFPGVALVTGTILLVSAAFSARVADVLRERRRTYQALQEMTVRSRAFIHAVTHNLRNPLNAIQLTASYLATRHAADLPPKLRERVERISRLADDAEVKVEALMELYKTASGKEARRTVELDRVVRGTVETFATAIAEKSLHVDVEPLPCLYSSPEKLGHIFENLLGNAVKYVPSGVGRIRVRAEYDEDRCTIAVEDNGIGISPEHLERVFEVFWRAPADEQCVDGRPVAGTGVGLALVKHLVDELGGWIRISSAPGAGTRVDVTFPTRAVALAA